jgi:hypothetical protein
MPSGKLVCFGVWEDDRFIGAVLFGRGANDGIGSPYGLDQTGVCELVRVALTKHDAPVSRIIAVAMKLLRASCPGLRLVVSYADSSRGHVGGIYQAGNWVFVGTMKTPTDYRIHGKFMHSRSMSALRRSKGANGNRELSCLAWARRYIDPNAVEVPSGLKHKYLMPLDDEMRAKVQTLAKDYPRKKMRVVSSAGAALGDQSREGGSIPTTTLEAKGTTHG